jgi:hypothetical protein
VKPFRRNTAAPRAAAGVEPQESRLGRVRPITVDYDEARSSEERRTYHQPRLIAQGEFLLDAHPMRRLKSVLGRAKRRSR